jgi:2-polyprenyl-3-methyl-5-hydroxy-6-metoxy-1,4-benzoquinol methylase
VFNFYGDHLGRGEFLDIGCGSGNYTGALETKGLDIEGIDISDEMLRQQKFLQQSP